MTVTLLAEFEGALDRIYGLAERHPGFIWRIPDEDIATQLAQHGFDHKTSATVSVWRSYEDLRNYTYQSEHGTFLKRASEWFEAVSGPQLVIWNVEENEKPDFSEAMKRLEFLRSNGPSPEAFGWLQSAG